LEVLRPWTLAQGRPEPKESRGENIGIGKIVGPFEAFISEPQEVEAGSVAIKKPVPVRLPSALAPV
jgi:hypothetical protein